MIKEIVNAASSVAEPLALAAFVAALFFLAIKSLLSSKGSPRLAKVIIDRFWYLSLAALFVGLVCFIVKTTSAKHIAERRPPVLNTVTAPNSGTINQAGGDIVVPPK